MVILHPREDTQNALSEYAVGRCLNIGTGTGLSANILLANPNVISVTTMDESEEFAYTADPAVEVVSYDPYIDREFDFVFIDDWSERWKVAKYWYDRGALVIVDEAHIVPPMKRGMDAQGFAYTMLGKDRYAPALIPRAE